MHPQGDLPSLRASVRLGGKDSNIATPWYDVKFYPYTPAGVDPVFAVVGDRDTVVCRCILEKDKAVEIIRWFKDDDENASLNSVEWSQSHSGDPLVCIAGGIPKIKILNVKTGELVTTLTGHGALINDLAISPVSPLILASGSMDHSIRIWSLDPAHAKNPTAVKCGGEGHKEGVLTVAFHRTGRYLLSGGMDTIVNLWVIPELPDENTGTDKPTLIHYPHFSTTEIHTDFVDCARFYNDLILSRSAKENKLLLWRIDHFTSSTPPPPPSAAPIPSSATNSSTANDSSGTRSAWGGRFQRLLQFDAPHTNLFYMRFGLFHERGARPGLGMGNERSRVFWWDLQRLEEAGEGADAGGGFKVPGKKGRKDGGAAAAAGLLGMGGAAGGGFLSRPGLGREESIASNVSHASSAAVSSAASTSVSAEKEKEKEKDAGAGAGAAASLANTTTAGTCTTSSIIDPARDVKDSTKEKEKDSQKETAKESRVVKASVGVGDPFHPIPAHKSVVVGKVTFATRQISWSRGGEWAVAVGDQGMVCLFRRWEDGVSGNTS